MSEQPSPDDHLYDHVLHLTSGGDGIRASISDDRIVIEDRGDGHFVVINSEQARRLQQWLAEMERLKMSEPSDKLCNDASQSTRPATPEAGGLLTSKNQMREGPLVAVTKHCTGCRYLTSQRYAVQGDSGTDYTCLHPMRAGMVNYVGDTNTSTPDWCPQAATDTLGEEIYALLVRRGYAQHEAHLIAGGPGCTADCVRKGEPDYDCPAHGKRAQEDNSSLDGEFFEALDRAGVREPLEVYDSNSYRRVGTKGQYRELVYAEQQRPDGHLSIHGTPLLRAMVAAFNAMLARSGEKASAQCPGCGKKYPEECDWCSEDVAHPSEGGMVLNVAGTAAYPARQFIEVNEDGSPVNGRPQS